MTVAIEDSRAESYSILSGHLHIAWCVMPGDMDCYSGGACDPSAELAELRATSEAIERRALREPDPGAIRAGRWSDPHVPAPAIPSDDFAATQSWVIGTGMSTGAARAVPAALVYVGWEQPRPLPNKQSSVGAAVHPDRNQAARSGLFECFERHAVRGVWQGRNRLVNRTDQLMDLMSAGLRTEFERQRLFAWAWMISDSAPLACSILAIARSDRPQVTLGASAGMDSNRSLLHALHEAVSVRAALASRHANSRMFRQARRSTRHQRALLEYFSALETSASPQFGLDDDSALERLTAERLTVEPIVVDLNPVNGRHVLKVVIPQPDYVLSPLTREYLMSPGYME